MAIVDEFEAMIEAGAGLVVATVGRDGLPRVGRAWAAAATGADRGGLRVVVSADDATTVANLEAAGVVAVTVADVRTLRSLQVKGRTLCVEPPTVGDLAEAERQTDRFFEAVHEVDGLPVQQLRRLLPGKVLAVEIAVDEQFDQSPGPAAGVRIGQAS